MLYQVKQKPEDFRVEEVLPDNCPSWEWDFLYILFEKNSLTTMEVIDFLSQKFHIQRDELWIAWLKDKSWITRQWLSISKKTLKRIWWDVKFVETLLQKVEILETSYHNVPLKVASNIWNNFKIRLRAKQQISEDIKSQIEKNIQKIIEKWFPNCFWTQRFGKWKKNFYEAKDFLLDLAEKYRENWKLDVENLPYHLRFQLQAYPSMFFNEYALNRWEKGLFLLWGDIVVDRYFSNWVQTAVYENNHIKTFDYQKMKTEKTEWRTFEPELSDESLPMDYDKRFPTWPMLWWNLLLSPSDSKARVRDNQLLELANFDEWVQQVCKIYNLWWIRRVLFVKVSNFRYSWEWNDLLLEFFLPTWSYATVLLFFVLEWIDRLTLKDNSLIIPRINNKN